jgi:hypothetical protein
MRTFIKGVSGLLVLLIVFTAMVSNQSVKAQTKVERSDLKILYVGKNPEKGLSKKDQKYAKNKERILAMQQKRSANYENFLNKYFNTVDVVYSEDYKGDMSAMYDVTIIDDYLPALSGGYVKDPKTGEKKYEMPKYLTEEFDHATVMIGEPSAFIGQGRQLKIDHLCLCLDAFAHGMNLKHDIFHKPYKVEVSYEDVKTPGNYKIRYTGRNLGDTMPMWRIQTEGYEDGKGFPVGLVSTGFGFDNGIDAEQISNGKCAKGAEATAIGRHANFFHWGFAAAPEYMTESAKLTLINSIHYIAQFKGAKQITRRIKGVKLRAYERNSQWAFSDEGWAAMIPYYSNNIENYRERQKVVLAKKAAGEKLTEHEKIMADMEVKPITRETTLDYTSEELKEKFGKDWAAYEKYYKENMDYFYGLEGEWYKSAVDEDAKALGIPNSSIKLLDKAVKMLKKGEKVDMAKRILKRYTKESFESATEWAKWFKKNRKNLYFSEGDCYKWIVLP